MSILIVDDSSTFRGLIKALLKNEDLPPLYFCESALEAYEILGDGGKGTGGAFIKLILMDLNMPDINGIKACAHIKLISGLHDIPIIMLTGTIDSGFMEDAFAAGAHDYITKPPKKNELLARVKAALSLKDEIDQRKIQTEKLRRTSDKLKKANEKLRRLSSIDGLTQLPNRRNFDEYLHKMWTKALREQKPISMLLMDIDYFKKYNDTHGHLKGDDCLKKVAKFINAAIKRPVDLVARYGGEEFAVIMPDTKLKGAAFKAEHVRSSVSGFRLPHNAPGAGAHVTVSLGVATIIPGKGQQSGDLIIASDEALYRAKEGGRNRVEVNNG